MAAPRRKQENDKNLQILRELITLNGNNYCFDCNQRGPTYVNTTIGSFVCSKCSGMLRGLTPPHRVKSISMATFSPEEIDIIKKRGNDYCRRVWLGLYEGESSSLKDEQSIKDFMSDKYEKKRYMDPSINITNINGVSKNTSVLKNNKIVNNVDQLVSITSNSSKSNSLINNNVRKAVNNNISSVNSANPPVPDFQVDFSTAIIYNSSQHVNNNVRNNSIPILPIQNNIITNHGNTNHLNGFSKTAFTSPAQAPQNDRYAALAELDTTFRQQNVGKNFEEGSELTNRNPFQTPSSNDLFASKNPFYNAAAWTNQISTPVMQSNPFSTTNNNGTNLINSKNPFL